MTKGISLGVAVSLISIIMYWLWSAASLPKGGTSWDIRSLMPLVKFFAGMEIGVGLIASVVIVGLYAIRSYVEHIAPKALR